MVAKQDTSRKGFSLVELLVVIGIIGVLVAMLIPAVQKARESANRTVCANNLKQIGLACAAYSNDYGYLPMDGYYVPGNGPGTYYGYATAEIGLLPFLEQDGLYAAFWNRDTPVGNMLGFPAAYDPTTAGAAVPTFACPSQSPTGVVAMSNLPAFTGSYGITSYAINHDLGCYIYGVSSGPQTPLRPEDVADGLTNTILYGEHSLYDPNFASWLGGKALLEFPPFKSDIISNTAALWQVTGVWTQGSGSGPATNYLAQGNFAGIHGQNEYNVINDSIAPGQEIPWNGFNGIFQGAGDAAYDAAIAADGFTLEKTNSGAAGISPVPFNYMLPPYNSNMDAGPVVYRLSSFGSLHPNGANMAFCDGSVHFITNSITNATVIPPTALMYTDDKSASQKAYANMSLLQALMTPQGGEGINEALISQ